MKKIAIVFALLLTGCDEKEQPLSPAQKNDLITVYASCIHASEGRIDAENCGYHVQAMVPHDH